MSGLFDNIIKRRGSGSYKWDTPKSDDVLPMWVADMDFPVAPCIQKALEKRVNHGVFGYTLVGESYYNAVINWFGMRHNWTIERENILYTSGVVPAISCCIKAMCMTGRECTCADTRLQLFLFKHTQSGMPDCGKRIGKRGQHLQNRFRRFRTQVRRRQDHRFSSLQSSQSRGTCGTREELEKMNNICMRHGVRVIADEIHCELVMPGHEYTPFASVSKECEDNCVALGSPSKAFNTAGLQIANIVCSNSELRRRIDRAINIFEVCDVNPFGPVALEAAYTKEGERWLEELNGCIWKNYQTLKIFLADNLPQIKVMELEGTYLAWLDRRDLGISSAEAEELLLEKKANSCFRGTDYGQKAGEGYLRMNLACPPQLLEEGLKRMKATFAK